MTISERGRFGILIFADSLDYLSGNRSVTIEQDCERYCQAMPQEKVNLDKDLLAILCCPKASEAVRSSLADEQLIQGEH
ncbi:MAG: hypothetical protein IPO99_16080 [Nitrospira sp.]|nr:hypothetical protein [Nitrospira sp.]